MYNIVNIRNRWINSGFLGGLNNSRQELELARLLERVANYILSKDDYPTSMSDRLPFMLVSEFYWLINIYFTLPENTQALLRNRDERFINNFDFENKLIKLKDSNHKFNVEELIDMSIDTWIYLYETTMSLNEYRVKDEVMCNYVDKYAK